MAKVLFLPFLQIPSGHHQVVTSLVDRLDQADLSIQYEKVDILSYTFKHIEPLVSSIYLKWINILPSVYHWIYERSVYRELDKEKNFRLYEMLFLKSMKKLLDNVRPDFIICTHALPSYLVSKLKEYGHCEACIINVYTDFFIHHIWGTKTVDAHFISLASMREYLINKGVPESSIYQTGIPIHSRFNFCENKAKEQNQMMKVLVTGGSLGVGKIEKMLSSIPIEGNLHYFVLCGNNKALYQRLLTKRHLRITPFPYINSKSELNDLYNSVDAVLTKPGGVTLSECLFKQKPIIIYDVLPGQEKINVDALINENLIKVIDLSDPPTFEQKLLNELKSNEFVNEQTKQLKRYREELERVNPIDLILQRITV